MTNNAPETKVNTVGNEAAVKDYNENFMPAVHRIGRFTMGVAFILAFLPVLYFVFIKGYSLPLASYLNTAAVLASVGIGMWLTEPLSYWPILGSAGTYIAYLSGNVGGMRFPVAMNVQAAMKADINTPKGQVITIVGIVASVVSNLIVLFLIVLFGALLIEVLPDPVMGAFSFVTPGLFGSMILMRFKGHPKGIKAGFLSAAPFLLTSVCVKLAITYVFPSLATIGTALAVGITILVAYVMFKAKQKKAA